MKVEMKDVKKDVKKYTVYTYTPILGVDGNFRYVAEVSECIEEVVPVQTLFDLAPDIESWIRKWADRWDGDE